MINWFEADALRFNQSIKLTCIILYIVKYLKFKNSRKSVILKVEVEYDTHLANKLIDYFT